MVCLKSRLSHLKLLNSHNITLVYTTEKCSVRKAEANSFSYLILPTRRKVCVSNTEEVIFAIQISQTHLSKWIPQLPLELQTALDCSLVACEIFGQNNSKIPAILVISTHPCCSDCCSRSYRRHSDSPGGS